METESVLLRTFSSATDGVHRMNIPKNVMCITLELLYPPFLFLSRLQPVCTSQSAIFASRQFLRSSWMDDGIIISHTL
jgi:hypothetical protein